MPIGEIERQRKLEESRERRQELKQPRDWQIWWAYLIHFIQGAAAGVLAMYSVEKSDLQLAIIAFTSVIMYNVYQGLSFARKWDTVGRDCKDHAYGWALGILITFIYFKFM